MKGLCLGDGLKRIQDSELAEKLRTDTVQRAWYGENTEIAVGPGIGEVGDIEHWVTHLGNRTQQSGDMAWSDTTKISEPLT